MISRDEISIDPSKMEATLSWKRPTIMSKVKSFSGMARYYGRFIGCYFKIALPLTRLTQKNVKFIWSKECQSSFEEFRNKLVFALILTITSSSRGFVVYSDAPHQSLGCVLMQYGEVVAYSFR